MSVLAIFMHVIALAWNHYSTGALLLTDAKRGPGLAPGGHPLI